MATGGTVLFGLKAVLGMAAGNMRPGPHLPCPFALLLRFAYVFGCRCGNSGGSAHRPSFFGLVGIPTVPQPPRCATCPLGTRLLLHFSPRHYPPCPFGNIPFASLCRTGRWTAAGSPCFCALLPQAHYAAFGTLRTTRFAGGDAHAHCRAHLARAGGAPHAPRLHFYMPRYPLHGLQPQPSVWTLYHGGHQDDKTAAWRDSSFLGAVDLELFISVRGYLPFLLLLL